MAARQNAHPPGGGIVVDGKWYPNARAWRLDVDAREAADPSGRRFYDPGLLRGATASRGRGTPPGQTTVNHGDMNGDVHVHVPSGDPETIGRSVYSWMKKTLTPSANFGLDH
jgi:hypothetical protein